MGKSKRKPKGIMGFFKPKPKGAAARESAAKADSKSTEAKVDYGSDDNERALLPGLSRQQSSTRRTKGRTLRTPNPGRGTGRPRSSGI